MSSPVIFLAFANNPTNQLQNLIEEDSHLKESLLPGHQQRYYDLQHEQWATLSKIGKTLRHFHNKIIIFHYAGHANSDSLLLSDNTLTSSSTIADLLGLQKQLKLVFLNGCSTQEQVKGLLERGIPAIITTSVQINDKSASDFAAIFYDALAKGSSIADSFEYAKSEFVAKHHDVVFYRGSKLPEAQDNGRNSAQDWMLLTQDELAGQWQLPRRVNSRSTFSLQSFKTTLKEIVQLDFMNWRSMLVKLLSVLVFAQLLNYFHQFLLISLNSVALSHVSVGVILASLLFVVFYLLKTRITFYKAMKEGEPLPEITKGKQSKKAKDIEAQKSYTEQKKKYSHDFLRGSLVGRWAVFLTSILLLIIGGKIIEGHFYFHGNFLTTSEVVTPNYSSNLGNSKKPYLIAINRISQKGSIAEKMDFRYRLKREFEKEIEKYDLPIEVDIDLLAENQVDSIAGVKNGLYVIEGFYDDYEAHLKVYDRSRSKTDEEFNAVFLSKYAEPDKLLKIKDTIAINPRFNQIEKEFGLKYPREYSIRNSIPRELKYFVMKMIGELALKIYKISLVRNPSNGPQDNLFKLTEACLKLAESNVDFRINWFGFHPRTDPKLICSNLYASLADLLCTKSRRMMSNESGVVENGNEIKRMVDSIYPLVEEGVNYSERALKFAKNEHLGIVNKYYYKSIKFGLNLLKYQIRFNSEVYQLNMNYNAFKSAQFLTKKANIDLKDVPNYLDQLKGFRKRCRRLISSLTKDDIEMQIEIQSDKSDDAQTVSLLFLLHYIQISVEIEKLVKTVESSLNELEKQENETRAMLRNVYKK